MKNKWLYSIVAIVLAVAMISVGAYSYFTDYAVSELKAQGGVSLKLEEGRGVSSVSQQGYAVMKNDVGWYKLGTKATLSAELKVGYSFEGWYNEDALVSDAQSFEYTMNGYSVLTAVAVPIVYDITYDTNGGTLPDDVDTDYTVEDPATLPTPTRPGYDFEGWYESEDPWEDGPVAVTPVDAPEDKTYHAKWEPIVYKITYVPNGGTVPADADKDYTVEDHATLPTPTRKGYDFKGWFKDSGLTDGPKTTTEGELGDKTYYAKWEPIIYDITYDPAGGTMPENPDTKYTIEEETKLPTPTRPGYEFEGWDDKDVPGEKPVDTIPKGETGDKDFIAVWTPITYTIRFNGNGATSGSMADLPMTYDVVKNLPANIFSQPGYAFAGWAESATGAVKYVDKASVSNMTTQNGATINLYAKWNVINYQITYVPNGGTVPADADKDYTVEDHATLPIPTRKGYDFKGWFKDSGLTDGPKTTTEGELGDKTYYAKWEPIIYDITYDPAGGTMPDNPDSKYTIEEETKLPTPTKPGYEFEGWDDKDVPGEDPVDTIPKGETGDKDFIAVWTPITYTIRFNGNGATSGSMADLPMTYDVAKNLTANAFSRKGYTFAGWAESDSGAVKYADKASVSNLTTVGGATVNLYAKWIIVDNNITYDPDGGVLPENPDTNYNIEEVTPLPVPIKPGYDFEGWDDKDVPGEDPVDSIPKGETGDKDFIAVWTPITYTIRFNGNGATSGSMADLPMTYDVAKNLTANAYGKPGYAFAGWAESATGAVKYVDKASVSNLTTVDGATISLFAKWNIINYKITYVPNGGTVPADADTSYNVEDHATLPTPTRPGYNFKGWFKDSGLTDGPKTSTQGETGDKTYYAKWEPIVYSITYNLNGGTVSAANPTSYTVESAAFTLNNPSQGGKVFAGWTGSNGTTAQTTVTIANGTTGNLTFTANWKAASATYTVQHWQQKVDGGTDQTSANFTLVTGDTKTLNGIVGENVSPDVNAYAGFKSPEKKTAIVAADGSTVVNYYYLRESYALTVTAGTGIESVSGAGSYRFGATVTIDATASAGYEFGGWDGTYDTNTKRYSFTMPAGNVTETAVGKLIPYTISYELNGGAVATANPTSFNVTTATFTLNNPTKVGYTFTGWTGSNGTTPQTSVSVTKGTTGNLSFTANWTAADVNYTVQHWQQKVDGGNEQTSANFTLVTGDTKTLIAKTGSNVTPDVNAYAGFKSPEKKTATVAADGSTVINYYYLRESYTLTLNAGYGIESVSGAGSYRYGASVNIDATPSAGYKFSGWDGTYDATIKQYSFTMPAGNVTETASGKLIVYTITYELNGGTVSTANPTTYTVETPTFTLNNPAKDKTNFLGWTGSNGTAKQTSVSVTKGTTGNLTFTANYGLLPFKITSNNRTEVGYKGYSSENLEIPEKFQASDGKWYFPVSVEPYAFYDCDGLKSVKYAGTILSIGYSAFESCDGMSSVTIPGSLKKIDFDAFRNCDTLTNVTIAEGVTEIGNAAFAMCDNLTSLHIPASVSKIGYAPCYNETESVKEITVDSANPYYCSVDGVLYTKDMTKLIQYPTGKKLDTFVIPDTVKTIGSYAFFFEREDLMTITVPEGVTTLEESAFWECEVLATITLPSTVTTVEPGSLGGCDRLESINVVDANETYCSVDGVLYTKDMKKLVAFPGDKKTEFTVPEGVTTIGEEAFAGANELAVLTLPEGVTTIEDWAFYGMYNYLRNPKTGLKTIYIPASVTKLGTMLFEGDQLMSNIYYAGSETQWNAIEKDAQWYNMMQTVCRINFAVPTSLTSELESAIPEGVTAGEALSISSMPDVTGLSEQAAANAPENTVLYGWLVDSGMAQQIVTLEEFEAALHSVYDEVPDWEMTITPLYQAVGG